MKQPSNGTSDVAAAPVVESSIYDFSPQNTELVQALEALDAKDAEAPLIPESKFTAAIKVGWQIVQGLAMLRSLIASTSARLSSVRRSPAPQPAPMFLLPTLPEKKKSFWSTTGGKVVGVTAGSLALAGVGAFIYATKIETRRFGIESVDITTGDGVKLLGKGEFEQREFRILHLSDLHLVGEDFEKAAFLREVTSQEFDIVVLTGDIFEKYSGIKYASSLLARKPRIGAFAVLGNHDYYKYSMFNKIAGRLLRRYRTPPERREVAPMISSLREVGYTVLQNEAVSVPEHKLHVVGIDWPSIEEKELMELVADVPEDFFSLCLFHLPKNLNNISKADVDLAVGGHTHGGQVRMPGFGAIITDSELARHEASGVLWRGKTAFHISRGLGADPRSNIRFFCPPAVTVLRVLHKQSKPNRPV